MNDGSREGPVKVHLYFGEGEIGPVFFAEGNRPSATVRKDRESVMREIERGVKALMSEAGGDKAQATTLFFTLNPEAYKRYRDIARRE